jgi:hypothetical protein
MLAKFFITISHCAWRHFISLSNGDKETKQRKRLSTICIKCPQRAGHCFWFPRSTVLANHGHLNPSFSRILTSPRFATSALGQVRHAPRVGTASPLFKVDCRSSVRSDFLRGYSRITRSLPLFFMCDAQTNCAPCAPLLMGSRNTQSTNP